MRFLNIIFCLLLLLFIAVQYNDPDGFLWMVIYLVPVLWTAVAAWRPALLCRATAMSLLGVCLLATVAGVIYYWPTMPDWWRKEVWWEEETAREGMGIMIVLTALLVVAITGYLNRPERTKMASVDD